MKNSLAIIGFGPRGLYALEQLLAQLSHKNQFSDIKICVFNDAKFSGAGQVYDLLQIDTNWINITERALDIPKRSKITLGNHEISAFPDYKTWAKFNHSTMQDDTCPPRNYIGSYLFDRANSLLGNVYLMDNIEFINAKIIKLKYKEKTFILSDQNHNTYKFNDILLTVGHQPTKDAEQIIKWQNFIKNHSQFTLINHTYPTRNWFKKIDFEQKNHFAIRGFGLAMIDVARALAEEYGNFIENNDEKRTLKYEPFLTADFKILPFSLDGLPMSPKPLNAEIDTWFQPTEKDLDKFRQNLIRLHNNEIDAQPKEFLIDAITPIIEQVFLSLNTKAKHLNIYKFKIQQLIKDFLRDKECIKNHEILTQPNNSSLDQMKCLADMATGHEQISLDYCIGQVWRHLQPIIYKELSHNKLNHEGFYEIIMLDERLKRYAYGPPVASIRQMIALIEAGYMTTMMVDDPDIILNEKGWLLKDNKNGIYANVMIDSVLDAPDISKVKSGIICSLLEQNLIKPYYRNLGILTNKNGKIISEKNINLYVLGRLAKGTVIGVDAILECFGDRIENWAYAYCHQLNDQY